MGVVSLGPGLFGYFGPQMLLDVAVSLDGKGHDAGT